MFTFIFLELIAWFLTFYQYISHSLHLSICVRFLEFNYHVFYGSHNFFPQHHWKSEIRHIFEISLVQFAYDALVWVFWVRHNDSWLDFHRANLFNCFVLLFVPWNNRKSIVIFFWPITTRNDATTYPFRNPHNVRYCPRHVRLESYNFFTIRKFFHSLYAFHRFPIKTILCGIIKSGKKKLWW